MGVLILQRIIASATRGLSSVLSVLLDLLRMVAILGFFGVQTTTFAAVLAAVGIAIGMAWIGLLSNFAAGVFLVLFKPFKVGDFVTAGGITGTMHEIGIFVTTIGGPDDVSTVVGNNKIFVDNIQNFSANPYRRVDLIAQLAQSVDHTDAIRRLKDVLAKIPNALTSPAPDVEIL
jgi:small conductance mechanosensitive channel